MTMAARNIHDRYEPTRETPVNLDAEFALLGALMINNGIRSSVPASFDAGHFSEPFHRELFEAIDRGIKAGRSINPVTVRSFLSPAFQQQKVGDLSVAQYLARLVAEAAPVGLVKEYAEAVTDYHFKRVAIEVGAAAEVAGYHSRDELEFIDQIKEARDRFNEILTSLAQRNEPETTFWDMVDNTLDQTGDAIVGKGLHGLDPGIPEMMQLTGPWQPGQLIVIGGDVKTGKSACAWQCAFNIAQHYPIGGYSGEMPVEQIIMREKARRTGISAKRQRLGQVSQVEMDELTKAGADIKRLQRIDISAKPMTLDDIDQRIARLQDQFGIKAFFVDHILKLHWTGKMEDADDFKKANKATSTLKNIALKRDICLVALTHINKGANSDTYGKTYADRLNTAIRRRPTYKSMLGNVDKDVDNMIIVHQPYPAVAALEPEPDTDDYARWEAAMERIKGQAEFILALSRENEFPRRKEIRWNGSSTSFGPEFKAQPIRELF